MYWLGIYLALGVGFYIGVVLCNLDSFSFLKRTYSRWSMISKVLAGFVFGVCLWPLSMVWLAINEMDG